MKIFVRCCASMTFFAWLSSAAFAWEVFVEGPDVFDKTKVVATESNFNEGLTIQCNSDDELLIAYIFKKKEFDSVAETPGKILIKVGEAPPMKLDGSLRAWNDNYGGVVASGRDPELVNVIKQIKDAKGKIQIGIEFLGSQASAEVSSRGSTKAMETVLSKCKLESAVEKTN
jgi:hypothetical protein